MTAIEISSPVDNEFRNITIWREDDGRYIVEVQEWPNGNAYGEDDKGNFPKAATSTYSDYFRTLAEAQKYADMY